MCRVHLLPGNAGRCWLGENMNENENKNIEYSTERHNHLGRVEEQIRAELRNLRGGVIDTSTLIHADRLHLLPLLSRQFHVVLIPQVVMEFGRQPDDMELFADAPTGPADTALWQSAMLLDLPILSEDGRLLRQARRRGHPHYNTLMLLPALHAQGMLPIADWLRLHAVLLEFARYGPQVIAHGNAVLRMMTQATGTCR